ncbi:MAG: ribose 5-phosphate isomerase B [Desulfovibrionaceae bacterium]|nr:ribose 5-phosphate isomerase B [Desulfovibrionaceae bacterium]
MPVPMETPFFIGSDHAGFDLKKILRAHLEKLKRTVEDLGAHSTESCDYPEAASAVCGAVLGGNGLGILICGTGLGMSMAANRYRGIRAAVCAHTFHARAARAHNNANVLCLGQRVTTPDLALEILEVFLETPYEGGRHERRLALLEHSPAGIG